MSNRFVVFDVETPNRSNDRISAIGITIVDNGIIIDNFYTLVNPEVHFDQFNITLTGINPDMVANKPNFTELWTIIEPFIGSGLLIAHNAQFDMSVLSKCLQDYSIEWQPYTYYACTCTMGRVCYPDLTNHRLDTLSKHLNINLNHHNAGSDSEACAYLLLNYIDQGVDPDQYIRRFNFTQKKSSKTIYKPKLS